MALTSSYKNGLELDQEGLEATGLATFANLHFTSKYIRHNFLNSGIK